MRIRMVRMDSWTGVFGAPVALAAALALAPTIAAAADQATIDAANEEGMVVFYSAAPTSVLDELTAAFSEKYPDIDAEYYRNNSAKTFQRLQAEVAAGRVEADVIHVSDPALIDDLKDAGGLMAYDSPEYANYPDSYVDPDDTWFVARGHFLILAYNPNEVDEAPTSWVALADPQWKDRVGIMDVRNAGGAYYWQYAMNKLFGPDYFEDVAANNPATFGGHGPINDRIVSGELALGVDLNYLVDESVIEKGAPVVGVYPDEGSPMILSPTGIVAQAPHPNAAKVFLDYLASPEGQRIFNSVYSYSMRDDVEAREGMKPLSEIQVLEMPIKDLIAEQEDVQAAARAAFGYK